MFLPEKESRKLYQILAKLRQLPEDVAFAARAEIRRALKRPMLRIVKDKTAAAVTHIGSRKMAWIALCVIAASIFADICDWPYGIPSFNPFL